MTHSRGVVVLALLVALANAVPAPAQSDNAGDVRARVALIDATFAAQGDERGAGLVIGVRGQSVLMATAAHVVRDQRDAPALSVAVSFPWDSRTYTQVTLIERHTDLDVAIVQVDAAPLAEVMAGQPFLCYRDPRANEQVTTIGHRLDDTWVISGADRVLTLDLANDTRRFTVSPRGIAPGSSGGPVLGEDGCLLGIVTTRDANEARVTDAEQVLALLGGGFAANLMSDEGAGTNSRRRSETFAEVGKTLNQYMFELEALALLFKRDKLEGEELRRLIEKYNAAYGLLYNGRAGMAAKLDEHFGRQRGAEYQTLVTQIDTVHTTFVYLKLNDAVAVLRKAGSLSNREYKALSAALATLDREMPLLRSAIDAYLARLQPLVRSLVGRH